MRGAVRATALQDEELHAGPSRRRAGGASGPAAGAVPGAHGGVAEQVSAADELNDLKSVFP